MVPATRLVAFLLAVLVAFSFASFGTAHAHAGTAGEVHLANGDHMAAVSSQHRQQTHALPCDDSDSDHGDKGGCCMSSASCAVCVPVPSAEFAFATLGGLAVPTALSIALPRDPPTLSRPPKLSVTA